MAVIIGTAVCTQLKFFTTDLAVHVLEDFVFVISFYLQCALLHSANCIKKIMQWHIEECSLALLCK
jgi:hypothetical protein